MGDFLYPQHNNDRQSDRHAILGREKAGGNNNARPFFD